MGPRIPDLTIRQLRERLSKRDSNEEQGIQMFSTPNRTNSLNKSRIHLLSNSNSRSDFSSDLD